jgi:hypothetical protein
MEVSGQLHASSTLPPGERENAQNTSMFPKYGLPKEVSIQKEWKCDVNKHVQFFRCK